MRANVRRALSLAMAAACTTVLAGQGPQVMENADKPAVVVVGCITKTGEAARSTGGSAAPRLAGSVSGYALTQVTAGSTDPAVAGATPASARPKPAIASRYVLDGTDSMVAPYVSQRVQVTGTVAAPAGGGAAPTLTVDSVMPVAATCGSGQ